MPAPPHKREEGDMDPTMQEHFGAYFDHWFLQLEANFQELIALPRDPSHAQEHLALVARALDHYNQYYRSKGEVVRTNVLLLFSPTWLSSLENAFLWMTGWKPSLVFRLVDSLRQVQVAGMNLGGLSEDQVRRLNEMRARTCAEEERVEREMERQQMAIAERRMLELARLARDSEEAVDRVDGMVDATLMGVMIGLERIVRNADGARLKALKRVVEVLNPAQALDFLAAAAMLQIQVRKWGMCTDGRKNNN